MKRRCEPRTNLERYARFQARKYFSREYARRLRQDDASERNSLTPRIPYSFISADESRVRRRHIEPWELAYQREVLRRVDEMPEPFRSALCAMANQTVRQHAAERRISRARVYQLAAEGKRMLFARYPSLRHEVVGK